MNEKKGSVNKKVIHSRKLSDQNNWNIQQKVLSLENSGKLSYNKFDYASNDTQAMVCKRIESTKSESIQMAYKYAKEFVKTIDPSNGFLEEDVELVLSRVEKDAFGISVGPSAGCVYASILISLALQSSETNSSEFGNDRNNITNWQNWTNWTYLQ